MRILPALLVLLVLLVPGGRAPLGTAMDAPAWTAGDFWEYRFNTSFGGIVWFNGTLRTDIVGIENRSVRGLAQEVYVVETAGSGDVEGMSLNGTWVLTGEQLLATSNRTILRNLLRLDGQGTVQGLNLPFVIQWTNRTENRVLRNDWSYPVPVGFSGTVSLNASVVENVYVQFGTNRTWENTTLETEVDLAVTLVGNDTVAVPAGPFETFTVRESWPDGSQERFDYAPSAGNNARTASYNASGGEVGRTELIAFRYQANERPPDGGAYWLLIATIAGIAGVCVAVSAWAVRRRRVREDEYTPPSLREPPTSGP